MSIYGVSFRPKSNQVSSGNIEGLPLPIFQGSLSVSLNFEGQPSATLSIENISEQEIQLYRNIYGQIGRKITLFGDIYTEVGSYAETEDLLAVDASLQIRSYNISVNLRGGNETAANKSVEVRTPTKKGVTRASRRGSNISVSNTLNLTHLANAARVPYSGYSFIKSLPANSPSFKISFSSLVQEQLRLNLKILDWTNQTVRTKDYRSGNTWNITSDDINYSVEVSKQVPSEYLDTVISGSEGLPFLSANQRRELTLRESFGDNPERKAPVELTTEEGDDIPTRPPLDVRKLRTIDMNFDFSGPRKTRKKTKTLNGQPSQEELFTYGLAYLAQDIRNLDAEDETQDVDVPALKSDSPEAFWEQIEYQKTEYIYRPVDANASVYLEGGNTPIRILGSSVFSSRYLTEVKTTGWKLSRFQQEQFDELGTEQNSLDSRWLKDEIDFLEAKTDKTIEDELDLQYARAQLHSITFRRVSYISRTQYVLDPATNLYSDIEQTPFTSQTVTRESLGESGDGSVLVAIPDPNYVFPMKVREERTLVQSFAQMDHPENIFIRHDREEVKNNSNLTEAEKNADLKDLKLLPWLITGEDTYRSLVRRILPSKNTTGKIRKDPRREDDIYLEYESNASHNDHMFQYSLQDKTFRTIVGKLPDATVFSDQFEDGKDDDNDNAPENFEYRVSSTNNTEAPILTDSLQYETTDRSKAVRAAQCELELDNFLSASDININLAWFYPKIRPGDYLNIIDDGSKKNMRVKNISFQIDYQGIVEGVPLKTCQGTSLTCGVMSTRPLVDARVRKDLYEDSELKSRVRSRTTIGSSIYPNIRTRRNPSANQQEEETGSVI